MQKIKLILNILFWAFEILARLCGHAEEIIKSWEKFKDGDNNNEDKYK